jgi:hypothetical protein
MYNFPKQGHNALFILHANHTFCAPHYTVIWACLALPYFPHYLINGMIFRKKVIEHKILFRFYLQLLSEKLLTVRRIQWDIIMKAYRSSREVPTTFVRLKPTWIF